MKPTISPEVARALAASRPVVALETSVVAQGLPPPHGLAAAARCEAAIRAAGAVPATVAVLGGRLVVGATPEEVARLAEPGRPVAKAGIRDLGVLLAAGADAGTTVSATVYAAAAAGIRLFATGGIGGVHREAGSGPRPGAAPALAAARPGSSRDVSSDLWALARYPVAVVSAGAKAILDLPATLEALETLGVPVVGLGVREFPAFYGNESGLPLEHGVAGPAEAAAVLAAHFGLGLGGVLLANPVPADRALPRARVDGAIEAALAEADAAGITGKALTPFLLGRIGRAEGLAAIETNLAVLEANAAAAARIAVALADRVVGPRSPR
jgi:pseudouridine-5'-phosphate glycosidase